jgi:hypothetical protein
VIGGLFQANSEVAVHHLGGLSRALGGLVLVVLFVVVAGDAGASGGSGTTYTPGTPVLATIANGTSAAPWNLFQGDPAFPAYASQSPGTLLPTYTPGGTTATFHSVTTPNLAVYPGATSGTDGNAPYASGAVGTPGPLAGYCGTGDNTTASAGSPARQPNSTTLPLAPAYFPHVVRNADGSFTGYFDYRPKDADEAIVAAHSSDGTTWTYQGQALEQNTGYCPSGDVNDDGQGHPNVLTVGGVPRLYTLQRSAGDNLGVGMLVHTLSPTPTNPLNGAPASEKVGVDPDDFASSGVSVPFTGGAAVAIPFSSPVGTGPEAMVAGPFVDLTQTPAPTATSIINCTGVGATSLTGCTTANSSGMSVQSGDLIEQVLAVIAPGNSANLASGPGLACASGSSVPTTTGGGHMPCQVPTGPNKTTGDGGLEGFSVTVSNANNLSMAIFNADAPNRAYIDGVAVYCNQSNAFPTNKIENCTTGPGNSALLVSNGDPVTADPIVPATAQQTTGLDGPDGIVGVLPSYPGAPAGSTVVMYTKKVLNYYDVGFTGSATTFSNGMSIQYTPFPGTASVSLGSGPTYTVYIGDNTTKNTIVTETCTGLTLGSPTNTLTGCTGGTPTHAIAKNSYIGGPGADIVSPGTLAQIGGGSPSTNAQKLYKNNEDLTELRVAYTTDGVNFSTAGLANGGLISGTGSQSSPGNPYTDLTNPSSTTSPAGGLNAYSTPGTQLATEMRFVGAAGTIITNPDGSYGLFLSGAWPADGDSDAFNQIWYSTSTDGESWSVPTSVISTDYTFAASVAQANNGGPLGISAYYSGRAYGPSVVQNLDGSLTMVFAGYRLPSPAGTAGTSYGTNPSALYTIGANDPLLYRQILTMHLTSSTSPGVGTSTAVTSSTGGVAALSSQAVTYTATVTVPPPGTGTPTGTVGFTDNGSPISGCTALPLSDSSPDTAQCTKKLPVGGHNIVATYSGDSNYASSFGPLTQNVVSGPPNEGLSISAGTVVTGAPVHATASLTFAAAGAGGSVTYMVYSDNACTSSIQSAGTVTVTNAIVPASNNVSFANPGTYYFKAAYSGDANDAPALSRCGAVNVIVPPKSNPNLGLSLSAGNVLTGASVHATASLTFAASGAGGSVTYTVYSDNACTSSIETAGTVTVTNGVVPASSDVSFADPGTYYFRAVYSGDANDNGATSRCGSVTVNAPPKANPNLGLSISAGTVAAGNPVHATASLTFAAAGAGGSVTYTVYSDSSCSATLQTAGVVTVTSGVVPASNDVTFANPGTYYFQAVYSGDANDNSATSRCGAVTVTG